MPDGAAAPHLELSDRRALQTARVALAELVDGGVRALGCGVGVSLPT